MYDKFSVFKNFYSENFVIIFHVFSTSFHALFKEKI